LASLGSMLSKFKKNRKAGSRKNVFFSILLGTGILLVIIFLFFTNWKINQRRTVLTARIAVLKEEIAILVQKNEELEEKKSQIESEEYLEKVARNQLGLKKPGEEVVVVAKEKEKEEEIIEEKKTWWEWLKNIWMRD